MEMEPVANPDIAVCGAGIIGLSLALEIRARGGSVVVLDRAAAAQGASIAAAGMLAAEDHHNQPELRSISRLSVSLYDAFLHRMEGISGVPVPFQTTTTIQYLDDGTAMRLDERSVDPRQLAASALGAVRRSGIGLLERCGDIRISEESGGVKIESESGPAICARQLVHASGAWFGGRPRITPRKGQMLRVRIPPTLELDVVHRSAEIYIVPRTKGAQAGTALIGATDEDAGFDLSTSQADLEQLRGRAAVILKELGSTAEAPQVEAWAGLRPASIDLLPAIGRMPGTAHQWLACGHYRNGILLAPATAAVLADMLEEKTPAVDVRPFDPARLM